MNYTHKEVYDIEDGIETQESQMEVHLVKVFLKDYFREFVFEDVRNMRNQVSIELPGAFRSLFAFPVEMEIIDIQPGHFKFKFDVYHGWDRQTKTTVDVVIENSTISL